jgi:hypothetical protein
MGVTAMPTQPAPDRRTARFALNERELQLQQYSLARAIIVAAENQEGIERNCFELEVSNSIEKHATGSLTSS